MRNGSRYIKPRRRLNSYLNLKNLTLSNPAVISNSLLNKTLYSWLL